MKVKFSSLQILDNYEKGYADGKEKGFNDGLKTGNEQGYNSALERLETTDITANGTYTPNDIGFKKVVVNVPDLNGDYQTGYNDGYSKGNTDGYSQGYSKGETDGYNNGYTKGENVGYTNGYTQGNTDGFNSGYTQGESVGQENGYNNALSKLDELTITQNGEYTPSEDKIGFSKVNVNIVDENGSYADGAKILGSYVDGSLKEIKAEYLEGMTELPKNAFEWKFLDLVELPESLITISDDIQMNGTIGTLIIPKSVSSIGRYAFNGGSAKTVYYNGSLQDYLYLTRDLKQETQNMFYVSDNQYIDGIPIDENYTLEIPTKAVSQGNEILIIVTGKYRFISLGMGKVIIPNTVITITDKSFSRCKNLSIIEIPNSVTSIGGRAFEYCEKLTDITLPESITSLGNLIFDRTASLGNKYTIRLLGTTPPTISSTTFTLNGGSKELINQIIVPKGTRETYISATNWSAYADYIVEESGGATEGLAYTLSSDGTYYSVSGIGTATDTDISIPSSYENLPVKEIGESAFNNDDTITSVIMSDTVISIGYRAFYDCDSLAEVTIPNSVTSISNYAFSACDNLTSITIPASVTSISAGALRIGSTENKGTITFLSTTPPTIGTNTFNTSYLQTIIVPKGYGEVYKSATNWSALADFIIESET